MGRPARGSVTWNNATNAWSVRVTLIDGTRSRPIEMSGLASCAVNATDPSKDCACEPCKRAHEAGAAVSARMRAGAHVDVATEETANEWFERYAKYEREKGQTDVTTKASRWKKWIAPRIGPKPMSAITRDDIEDVRDALDAAILAWTKLGRAEDRIGGKTAMNVWSCLTSAFKAAVNCKRRDLRVLAGLPNPCFGVEPPGDRDSRKARRKPFVYPWEAAQVFGCDEVAIEWREAHAVAAYSYLRPGELRVLTVADIDLRAMLIDVTKAWDYEEKALKAPKTRNGIRKVPIATALAPLLERLTEDRPRDAALLPVLSTVPENELASLFRAHLTCAGIERAELHHETRTHAMSNFRTWRDSGLTWLAMSGVDVTKIMRRAGHDHIQTTMSYVKQAEDLGEALGTPFGPLPDSLVEGIGGVSVFRSAPLNDSGTLQRRARDSNPWEACTST